MRFTSLETVPHVITSSQMAKAKAALWSWLDSDGFQEGADGASEVIAALLGDAIATKWVQEWYAKEREKGMANANA